MPTSVPSPAGCLCPRISWVSSLAHHPSIKMPAPRTIARAEKRALEGNNESQDSQAVLDEHIRRYGIGIVRPPKPPSPQSGQTSPQYIGGFETTSNVSLTFPGLLQMSSSPAPGEPATVPQSNPVATLGIDTKQSKYLSAFVPSYPLPLPSLETVRSRQL